ncbi:MAG: ABC transporter permease [Chloroflexi bacterium]|nr:MAG: ABC transporter permease [Chloroflexota bacterium]
MTINATPLTELAPPPAPPQPVVLQRAQFLRLPRSPKVIAGILLLAPFVVVSLISRWISPYSPNATDSQHWVRHVLVDGTGPGTNFPANYYPLPLPPSAAHLLGTTVFAQDVLSQLLASTQATLFVGLLAAAIATVLSVLVGVAAGYLGGNADEGLSLFSNVFLAIPGLPLLIVLADYVPSAGSSVLLVAVIIAVTAWAYSARVLRAQTLSLRNRDFVEAARVSGEGPVRIILVEVLPNLLAIIAASFLFTTLYATYAYVAISFLGLAGWPLELGEHAARGVRQQRDSWRVVVVVGSARHLRSTARDRAGAAQLRHRRVHQPPAAQRRPLPAGRSQGGHQPQHDAGHHARPGPAAGPSRRRDAYERRHRCRPRDPWVLGRLRLW